MSKPQVICLVPAKNEDWIIGKTLASLSLFADHIIVGDAGSWDKTVEISKKFPKVVIVDCANEPYMVGSRNRRQTLLDKAREFSKDALIFCFDADEIPTANILEPSFWDRIENLKPGQGLLMEWITLWRSPFSYRDDNSVWSGQHKAFAFCDDGKTNFPPGDLHEGRLPEGFEINLTKETDVKVLHFHFVLWGRMLSKQAHCRVKEYLGFHRSPMFINFRYGLTKDMSGLHTNVVPDKWLGLYKQHNVKFEDITSREYYWYDIEILKDFKTYGISRFGWLDIWDLDWEDKRLKAISDGYSDIPQEPIRDPRNMVQRLYHKLLKKIDMQRLTKIYGSIHSALGR